MCSKLGKCAVWMLVYHSPDVHMVFRSKLEHCINNEVGVRSMFVWYIFKRHHEYMQLFCRWLIYHTTTHKKTHFDENMLFGFHFIYLGFILFKLLIISHITKIVNLQNSTLVIVLFYKRELLMGCLMKLSRIIIALSLDLRKNTNLLIMSIAFKSLKKPFHWVNKKKITYLENRN